MSTEPSKITTRLPEPLRIKVREEAKRILCSESDIVRIALLSFFESKRQTNAVDSDGGSGK